MSEEYVDRYASGPLIQAAKYVGAMREWYRSMGGMLACMGSML